MREGVSPPRLITIPVSHYCERARWALDRADITYVEEGHVPLLHWRATLPHRTRTVPVLVTAGAVLRSSSEIVRWADARMTGGMHLYPTDPASRREVEELEEHFVAKLGPATRRWAYSYLLNDKRRALEVLSPGAPRAEVRKFAAGFSVIRHMIRKGMTVTPEGTNRSRERIRAIFSEVGARLRDGARYLVGDRFTAADLTFAALAIPIVAPPQFAWLPSIDSMRPEMRAEIEAHRATAAGQHALRIYREERPRTPSRLIEERA
jgi:glutathione S-transferase